MTISEAINGLGIKYDSGVRCSLKGPFVQPKPYYGITGITSLSQAKSLIRIITQLGMPQSHLLMLGYLVSWRGLSRGEVADPDQYLLPSQLHAAMLNDRRVVNILHYNSRASGLVRQIEELLAESSLIDGIQLNLAWPSLDELARLRERSYLRIILQLGPTALSEVGHDPARIAARACDYRGIVDDVLYDPSGGVGVTVDGATALEVIAALHAAGFETVGVAGGLKGDNLVTSLRPLVERFPRLSFDAQSGLRDPATRELDINGRCRMYLSAAHRLLQA